LPDVRSTDARSAKIDRSAGVALSFHVRLNKVEPCEARRTCNLLANDDARSALADETEELGPEMAGIVESELLSRSAKGSARARACPDRTVITPSGKPQGIGPDTDAGEEMALPKSGEIVSSNIDN
jgi:hypothetical protein